MTTDELKDRIKGLTFEVIKDRKTAEVAAVEFDELTNFLELKNIIVSLLTSEFDNFLSSIDWVAPRPTTFRINLQNDENFYLIWMGRSWIAQVEGKKYYLLNISEEQRAAEAISRILRYGVAGGDEEEEGVDTSGDEENSDEEVDITVDDTEDITV